MMKLTKACRVTWDAKGQITSRDDDCKGTVTYVNANAFEADTSKALDAEILRLRLTEAVPEDMSVSPEKAGR